MLDWLQYTIKKEWQSEQILEYLELIGINNKNLIHRYGVNGYKNRMVEEEKYAINFDGHSSGMGTNFCYFGNFFSADFEDKEFLKIISNMNNNLKVDLNVNRIDLQFTFEDPHFLDNLRKNLKLGAYTCKASKRKEIIEYSNNTNNITGSTFYFGSRRSEKFLRIYDKGAELGISVNKLIRVELELKGEKANQIFNRIVDGVSSMSIFKTELETFVRFIDCFYIGKNKSRADTEYFWQCFLDSLNSGADIVHLPKKETNLERKHKWLLNNVAPTMILVKTEFNKEIDLDMLGGKKI